LSAVENNFFLSTALKVTKIVRVNGKTVDYHPKCKTGVYVCYRYCILFTAYSLLPTAYHHLLTKKQLSLSP